MSAPVPSKRIEPLPDTLKPLSAPSASKSGDAGGQRHARGVDEAAAVAGDARRVGQDEVRLGAENLDIAQELGDVAAGHLVQDQLGRA